MGLFIQFPENGIKIKLFKCLKSRIDRIKEAREKDQDKMFYTLDIQVFLRVPQKMEIRKLTLVSP